MAASTVSVGGRKIVFNYAAECNFSENKIPVLSSSSAAPGTSLSPVVFKVQSFLNVSVARYPEFLEEEDWLPSRESSPIELPWSKEDGLVIIDDDDNLKISETLTLLRVPELAHQCIIDGLRRDAAAISLLAPEIVVHILEVAHITLPLLDEEGKAIHDDNEECHCLDYPVKTIEEEEPDQEEFVNSLKKLILGAGDITEEDEEAFINDWLLKLIDAIYRVAWEEKEEEEEEKEAKEEKEAMVEKEEEKEAKVEEEEKEAKVEKDEEKGAKVEKEEEKEAKVEKEEEKEARVEEEEWTCPICLEVSEPDYGWNGAWSQMLCCSQVFHSDCLSMWLKGVVKCPWCRSSTALICQSARGLIERYNSKHLVCPSRPGLHDLLLLLWHLLGARAWWILPHDPDCKCGCPDENLQMILA